MDIEGGEFEWINNVSSKQLSNISQITIEFHFPFTIDKFKSFKKLNQSHYLIHFHPNNSMGLKKLNNYIIPIVFECTYINKKLINKPELNRKSIPTYIDQKNNEEIDDIFLNCYPYVH